MRQSQSSQSCVCLLILSCYSVAAVEAYSGGGGTPACPYVLAGKQDILELASDPNNFDKSFLLLADIDMEGETFEHSPLAQDAGFNPNFGMYDGLFTGVFNGDGHVIENFAIAGRGPLGFFGAIGRTGRVMHLGLNNVRVEGPTASDVGMLAGINMGSIVGCYAQGQVSGLGNVGGLVGYQYRGTIVESFSLGQVHSVAGGAGGLVGVLATGTIERCYGACAVTSEIPSHGGGLVGRVEMFSRGSFPSEVSDSFWDVEVSGQSTSNGGLGLTTNEMHSPAVFLNARWDFADEQRNGINDIWTQPEGDSYPALSSFSGVQPVSLDGEGTVNNPFVVSTPRELAAVVYYGSAVFVLDADIDLSGITWAVPVARQFSGSLDGRGHCIRGFSQEGSCGLFGTIESGAAVMNLQLQGCEITAMDGPAGCLAGENRGHVAYCSADGIVSGGDVAGGLVGRNGGAIWQCSFTGAVRGHGTAGGLAGHNTGTLLSDWSAGAVSGDSNVGGLAGLNAGSIKSCYSIAAVIGRSNLGGLLGSNGGSVADCYARGAAAGTRRVGGLIGENTRNISNCYSTGFVAGLEDLGGLIGCDDVSAAGALNSFWDVDASRTRTSSGGTGIGRKQMQEIGTFLAGGWDFVGETANGFQDLWTMADDGYPALTMSIVYTAPLRR